MRRQPSHHVAGRGGVTRALALLQVVDHGEPVGLVHVAAVLELGGHRVDGDADAEDRLDLPGMCDRGVRHGEAGLEAVQLPAQDIGHAAGLVALVVDRRRTDQLHGGVVRGGNAQLRILVVDGLPGRRDEGPVPGHAQEHAGVLGDGAENRVGAHQVEADGVVFEQELGGDDDGDIAVPAGGHQVTEPGGLDEGAPLRLAEGGVSRGDVHRRARRHSGGALEVLYRLGAVSPVVDLAVGRPSDRVDDAHASGGLVAGQALLDVADHLGLGGRDRSARAVAPVPSPAPTPSPAPPAPVPSPANSITPTISSPNTG